MRASRANRVPITLVDQVARPGESGGRLDALAEYCTIGEVAQRLSLSPKRVRNMMAMGIFVEGEQFFRRKGIGPRFLWPRVVEWLRGEDLGPADIPMAQNRERVARRIQGV